MMHAYLQHELEGRLRIKVPDVKGAPHKAREVVQALKKVHGISHVQANTTTGSILLLFDPQIIRPAYIVLLLQDIGCHVQTPPQASEDGLQPGVGHRLAEVVVRTVVETAVQRAIMALL